MLSARLKSIVDFLQVDDYVADIGTDHALLPIYLIKNNLVKGVIAADVNANALDNAKKNIKENALESKITTVLSAGLSHVDLELVDTLVLAGMGTRTIISILEPDKLSKIEKIVIQSNREYSYLRKKVTKLGFYICDERITYDNKKYYLTICFKKGQKKYQRIVYDFGIIKKENSEYYHYLQDKYISIFKNIPSKKIIPKLKMFILIKKLDNIIKKI